MALAPDNFGPFSGDLLVGNFGFGDGKINAYDPNTGQFLGNITDANGNPLAIQGLWAIAFGNGGSGGDTDALYFAAGINRNGPNSFGAADGLFGSIRFSSPGGGGPAAATTGTSPGAAASGGNVGFLAGAGGRAGAGGSILTNGAFPPAGTAGDSVLAPAQMSPLDPEHLDQFFSSLSAQDSGLWDDLWLHLVWGDPLLHG